MIRKRVCDPVLRARCFVELDLTTGQKKGTAWCFVVPSYPVALSIVNRTGVVVQISQVQYDDQVAWANSVMDGTAANRAVKQEPQKNLVCRNLIAGYVCAAVCGAALAMLILLVLGHGF